ncbi:MAG: hypothetical protein KDD50_16545, partial [Bdellovibrionales bacterium]|nr:hypothetical protein [Bdellovibrionales bacterium]
SSSNLTEVQLSVISGREYLIQALALYKDSSTGAMVFYYGDILSRPINDNESVRINLNDIGSGSGKEIKIAGRYFNADGSTPTDIVAVTFKPPNGQPTMEIMQDIILAGWFNVFAVDGVTFDYYLLKAQKSMFSVDDPFNSSSTEFGNASHRVRVYMPDYYRSSGEFEPSSEMIYGFYGSYVEANSNDFVSCYDNAVSSVNLLNAYQSDLSTPIQYDATISSGTTKMYPMGGGDGSGSTCLSSAKPNILNLYYLYFNTSLRSLAGFAGPYAFMYSNGQYKVADTSSQTVNGPNTDINLTFLYLDGIYSAGIRTSLFVSDSETIQKFRPDGSEYVKCHALYLASQLTPLIIRRYDTSTETASGGTIPFSVVTSNLANLDGALCPYIEDVNGERSYLPAGSKLWGFQ